MDFYTTAVQEIVIRLPLENALFTEIKFNDPDIALNLENRDNLQDFPILKEKFKTYINKNKLIEECGKIDN